MNAVLFKIWAAFQASSGYIWFVTFLLPIWGFIALAIFLTICDAVSGMLAAKKRGEKITSRGFYRTLEKFAVYLLSIAAAAGLKTVFMSGSGVVPNIPLVEVVAGSICFNEFLSFRENVQTLTGIDILGGFKKVIGQFTEAMPEQKKF
jgi:phage-related holin